MGYFMIFHPRFYVIFLPYRLILPTVRDFIDLLIFILNSISNALGKFGALASI